MEKKRPEMLAEGSNCQELKDFQAALTDLRCGWRQSALEPKTSCLVEAAMSDPKGPGLAMLWPGRGSHGLCLLAFAQGCYVARASGFAPSGNAGKINMGQGGSESIHLQNCRALVH